MSFTSQRVAAVDLFTEAARSGQIFLAEVALKNAVELCCRGIPLDRINLTAFGRVRELIAEAHDARTGDERRELLQRGLDLLRRELIDPPAIPKFVPAKPKLTVITGGKS